MTLLIGFLTFILVVNCLLLMLLVLVQLPKKEAGAGLAFGGGATDALFGAGSGTALTKITKYTATSFLALALVLTVLNSRRHEGTSKVLQEELSRKSAAAPTVTTPPAAAPGQTPLPGTNTGALTLSPTTGAAPLTITPLTNVPAASPTSAEPAKAPAPQP